MNELYVNYASVLIQINHNDSSLEEASKIIDDGISVINNLINQTDNFDKMDLLKSCKANIMIIKVSINI